MLGLRSKLLLGVGGLLLTILIISIQGIVPVTELGGSIDVILRENYRSVIACQNMKESLERVDSATLFVLLGYESEGRAQIQEHLARFDRAMSTEGGNITLPDEAKVFSDLERAYAKYRKTLDDVCNTSQPPDSRRKMYFEEVLPLFFSIKQSADTILQMNQRNMSDANMTARQKAARTSQRMYLLLVCGTILAVAFVFFIRAWILRPIAGLINSTEEIRRGNLDLVVSSKSTDELGQLSRTFDAMTASLRESRRMNRARTSLLQGALHQAFKNLPHALAVVDVGGVLQLVSDRARNILGIEANTLLRDLPYPYAILFCDEAMNTGRVIDGPEPHNWIHKCANGKDFSFRIRAIPIREKEGVTVGALLFFEDVKHLQEDKEVQGESTSEVLQQTSALLGSIRMALYLLLDASTGPLTAKQEDLLAAARDDFERLEAIVDDIKTNRTSSAGQQEGEVI